MDRRQERLSDASAIVSGRAQRAAIGDDGGDASLEEDDVLGAVRIAPRVLRTVVEEAALRIAGVARMARMSGNLPQLVGRALPHHGVGLSVHEDTVTVDLYLVVEPSANMLEVGAAVQESVSAAVEHILGMQARQINVYIQDVA
jgi:uncharacterized alkaline shock family protein YloU